MTLTRQRRVIFIYIFFFVVGHSLSKRQGRRQEGVCSLKKLIFARFNTASIPSPTWKLKFIYERHSNLRSIIKLEMLNVECQKWMTSYQIFPSGTTWSLENRYVDIEAAKCKYDVSVATCRSAQLGFICFCYGSDRWDNLKVPH
jgi:hypothetical protein